TLRKLLAHPHGIDLGPLKPRVPEVLRTASGRIELAAAPLVADADRLRRALDARADDLVLIGRRHLRSNNSWMHNVRRPVGGSNNCPRQVHPDDAARLGLSHGARALVKGDGGELQVPVEITDTLRPGVVSLPHGWGHDRDGVRL